MRRWQSVGPDNETWAKKLKKVVKTDCIWNQCLHIANDSIYSSAPSETPQQVKIGKCAKNPTIQHNKREFAGLCIVHSDDWIMIGSSEKKKKTDYLSKSH